MPESQTRKIFRIQLTLPVVVLLTTLSTCSLAAAFYLGMVTEKSMQRPPEYNEVDSDISEEKPLSEEDLKFFGLSERNKEQESINLEELRDLKKKTEELIKNPIKPKLKTPEKPKPVSIEKPKSSSIEKTDLIQKEIPKPKKSEIPKTDTSKIKNPKIKDSAKELTVTKTSTSNIEGVAFTIQVFASRKQENAKKLVEKLKRSGFDNAFIFKHTAGGNPLYRVRVGKIERSKTKELAEKLKKLKYIQSVQVTRF
tara:strand:+ start:1702 stop:2463 length:762 start_codon:yes stop_codon:yes gene_type:complete